MTEQAGSGRPAARRRSGGRAGGTALVVLMLAAGVLLAPVPFFLNHSLLASDGAFQTFNAVQSFAAGEVLGAHFHSYLGALMPLSLVPLFLLLGGTVFASSAAAAVAVWLGTLLTVLALCRFSGLRGRSAPLLVGAGVVGVLGTYGPWLEELLRPGNSLRPLRWALPFLLVWAAAPLYRRCAARMAGGRAAIADAFALGALGGVGLLWSNDLGIPVLIAVLGCLGLLGLPRQPPAATALSLAAAVAGAAATVALVLSLLTAGRPASWLAYTFGDIRRDQFWYFGTWGEHDRVFGWRDLSRVFLTPEAPFLGAATGLLVVGCAVLAWRLLRRRGAPGRQAALLFLSASALGGAVLPQIGGHLSPDYAYGAVLPALFLPFALWPRPALAAARGYRAARERVRRLPRDWPLWFALASLALMLAATGLRVSRLMPARTGAVYSATIGAYTASQDAPALAVLEAARPVLAALAGPRGRVFSDYFSGPDLAAGARQPTPYPTVIHALGDANRAAYRDALAGAPFPLVTTLSPFYSVWAGWNLRANWWLHRPLLASREPFAQSRQYIFWRARASPAPEPTPLTCRLTGVEAGIARVVVGEGEELRDPRRRLVDLEVSLDARGPAPRFWRVEEVDTPLTRDPSRQDRPWEGYPFYGISPAAAQRLVVELGGGMPSILRVWRMPRDGTEAVPGGSCAARVWIADPIDRTLPELTLPLLEEVLRAGLPRVGGRER